MDEDKACEDKYDGECNDPTQGATPSDAVDIEEEIGKPLVASDEVPGVDEGYI